MKCTRHRVSGPGADRIPKEDSMPTGYPRNGRPPGSIRRPVQEQFWEKVNKTESCWLWTGGLTAMGYGSFRAQHEHGVTRVAHRFAYLTLVGPIGDGLELDHLCRVRHCVNPAHLEPVTHRENVRRGGGPTAANARKTHCINGHPLTGSNLQPGRKQRRCRECDNMRMRASRRKAKSVRLEGDQ